jgi:hypothetical protein
MHPAEASFVRQMKMLRGPLPRVAVVFHGSDIRDPAQSINRSGHSYFTEAPPDWVAAATRRTSRNRNEVEGLGCPVFVTTPDLLDHVRGARLLPLSIDVDAWRAADQPFDRRRIRVLHQPSQRSPAIKGTAHIDPVLTELHDSGAIEYVHTSTVGRRAMRKLVHSVDVVVDQLQAGAYGVTAVEAMSAGRLVVGDVSDESRRAMGGNVPILNATPKTFRDAMHQILQDRSQAMRLAQEGVAFARKWHDGSAALGVLAELLGNRPADPSTW